MKSTNVSLNKLPQVVQCPTSKSYSNRALILAALRRGEVILRDLADCDDTKFLIEGLKGLGLDIEGDLSCLRVLNSIFDIQKESAVELELGEGGTTIRFFMALATLMKRPISLNVHADFLKRPIGEYLELLRSLGAKAQVDEGKIHIQGPIQLGQSIEVDCSRTTQFASALELISEAANLKVEVVNVTASQAYLDMTKKVLEDMAELRDYRVPVDFSSLGYFLAYACLEQDLCISNVHAIDHFQADSKMLEIIKELGGQWKLDEEGLKVFKIESFKSASVDGSQCLDLIPTLIYLMSYSSKEQKIYNLANLRFKECDRLEEMLSMLKTFQIEHSYDSGKDELLIKGSSPDNRVRDLSVARDHRMVMVAALFLKSNGGGSVSPSEAVNKSFSEFFQYFQ